ncbi:MAG: hypothetical protein ACFFC9_11695, partial [Promethearchaeota archaeon]
VVTNNYTWIDSIDQTVWNQVGNGTVTIRFYANDTFNHLNFTEVSVRKNLYHPIIMIENPQDNQLFGIIAPNFNIYTSGTELNTTWYTLNDGIMNYTFTGLEGTINETAWASFGFGNIKITFYINDSLGKIGFDEVTIRKDPDPPLIAISSPNDETYYAFAPDIQVTATDPNLDSIWYDVGGIKILLTNGISEPLSSSIWDSLSEGEFILRIYANDTMGYINDTFILTLYKDTLAPFIVINNPQNQTYYNIRPSINITAYDPNLTNMYYMVGTNQVPLTNNVEQLLDINIWNSLEQGVFNIYIYAWDSLNHLNDTYVITLYKDTNVPIVEINSPSNSSYWKNPPILNVTAIDPNLHTIWYKVGSDIIELINNTAQLLADSIWNSLTEESFVIEIYANDSFGQLNDIFTLILYKDITPPALVINNPQNNTYYSNPPSINIDAIDASVDTIWYTISGNKIILTNGVTELLDSVIWGNLAQGEFILIIFANDSAGNLNDTFTLTLYKDTLAPLVVVNKPYNNTYWNSGPILNIIAYDPNNVLIRYRVYNYVQSIENNTDVLFSPGIWSYISEGEFILEILAEDSFYHLNDSIKLTLYKDTLKPQIIINVPQPNDLFGENPPSVSLNIQDANLDEIWYQLSNGTIVTNNYTWSGFIDQVIWDQVGNGTVTIRFYANDTAKNINYKDVSVRKNIFAPIITVNSPYNNELFGVNAPNFEIYQSGINIHSTWYMLIGVSVNYTFSGNSGVIDQDAWSNFGFGMVTIRFYINDSFGKVGTDEVIVRKDPEIPSVIINTPNNQTAFASPPLINLTILEPNLDNVWYKIGTTTVDITGTLEQYLDSALWNSLAQGSFMLELFANDTMGNLNNFYKLELSKDTLGPNITIILPHPNQKVDRNAPYFEVEIVDVNGIASSWYRIEGSEINILFTGEIGRIDQILWENLWDNLSQGEVITIRFYSNDTLGNENYTYVEIVKKEAFNIINFFISPMGMFLPIIGIGLMLPISLKLLNSRYYKSLEKHEKSKLKKVLILAFFFCSLSILFYLI